MNKLLSIDWDYVTGDCNGRCNSCCGFCHDEDKGWTVTSAFKFSSTPLIDDWYTRYTEVCSLPIRQSSNAFIAESHASIIQVINTLPKPLTILDYDYHGDINRDKERLFCGNWMSFLPSDTKVFSAANPHPTSCPKPSATILSSKATAVFLCKSSSWTPTSLDYYFYKLITKLSRTCDVQFIGHRKDDLANELLSIQGE